MCVDFKQKLTRIGQAFLRFAENTFCVGRRKDIQLAIDEHDEVLLARKVRGAYVMQSIVNRQPSSFRLILRVRNRRRRVVDSRASVTQRGEALSVQSWSARKIENPRRLFRQHLGVDPLDVLIDDLTAPARSVVRLRQVLHKHPPAESRIAPGNIVAFRPRSWLQVPVHDRVKLQLPWVLPVTELFPQMERLGDCAEMRCGITSSLYSLESLCIVFCARILYSAMPHCITGPHRERIKMLGDARRHNVTRTLLDQVHTAPLAQAP